MAVGRHRSSRPDPQQARLRLVIAGLDQILIGITAEMLPGNIFDIAADIVADNLRQDRCRTVRGGNGYRPLAFRSGNDIENTVKRIRCHCLDSDVAQKRPAH